MDENENNIQQAQIEAGQQLKRIREEKGLALKDISTATKINANTLEALEEGRVDELPAKSFTRGFIRAYAQYLKIDPKPIIEAYDMDDPFITSQGKVDPKSDEIKANAAAKEITPPSKRISGPKLDSFGKKPILVASIVLLILLVVGVKNVVDKYAQETVLPDSVKTESGSVILDKSKSEVDPSDEQDIAEETAAKDEGYKAIEVSESDVGLTAEPTTEPTAEPTAVPQVAATEPVKNETAEAKPTPAPTEAPKAQPHNILVEALDKVEIEIQIEGESDKDIKLEPGSVYEIKTEKKVTLEISDGGLVNLIFNGRDRGIAGDLGQPAKVSFP